jgi:hypothetical protein
MEKCLHFSFFSFLTYVLIHSYTQLYVFEFSPVLVHSLPLVSKHSLYFNHINWGGLCLSISRALRIVFNLSNI